MAAPAAASRACLARTLLRHHGRRRSDRADDASRPLAATARACRPNRRRGATWTTVRASSSDAHESPRSVVLEPAKCELLGNENGKYSLVGEMVLDSDADSLYAMLTDYAASPKIFATVDACDVSSLPDGKLLVSQSCRWKFMGVFGGAFPCHLAVLETPTERYMEVELHERGFIREFEGSWRVSEEPGGGVRVRHTLALRPALTPPYAHKIFLKQIGDILTDVEREVASWGGEEYVGTRKKAGEGAGDAEPLPAAR